MDFLDRLEDCLILLVSAEDGLFLYFFLFLPDLHASGIEFEMREGELVFEAMAGKGKEGKEGSGIGLFIDLIAFPCTFAEQFQICHFGIEEVELVVLVETDDLGAL